MGEVRWSITASYVVDRKWGEKMKIKIKKGGWRNANDRNKPLTGAPFFFSLPLFLTSFIIYSFSEIANGESAQSPSFHAWLTALARAMRGSLLSTRWLLSLLKHVYNHYVEYTIKTRMKCLHIYGWPPQKECMKLQFRRQRPQLSPCAINVCVCVFV